MFKLIAPDPSSENVGMYEENSPKSGKKLVKIQKKKKKEVPIAIKGIGELIGSEEIIDELQTRTYSCRCCSGSAEFVKISKENFLNKIMHPEAMLTMKNITKNKNE